MDMMYVQFVHIDTRFALGEGSRCSSSGTKTKRQANLAKHLIDFSDALQVFDDPVFEKVQWRHRRANRNERQDYANQLKAADKRRNRP